MDMLKTIIGLLLGVSLTALLFITPSVAVADGYMSINDIIQLKIDCYDLWQDTKGNTIYFTGGNN
jgi:hypothetical protein